MGYKSWVTRYLSELVTDIENTAESFEAGEIDTEELVVRLEAHRNAKDEIKDYANVNDVVLQEHQVRMFADIGIQIANTAERIHNARVKDTSISLLQQLVNWLTDKLNMVERM